MKYDYLCTYERNRYILMCALTLYREKKEKKKIKDKGIEIFINIVEQIGSQRKCF